MSKEENLAFPIPNYILEPYIKTAVSTVITTALGDGTELVSKAVHAALSQKVNAHGKVDQYQSCNTNAFIEVVAAQAIREVAHAVIKEMAESMKPKIKTAIEKQIITKHKDIAKVLVDQTIESLKSSYSVKISFKEDNY